MSRPMSRASRALKAKVADYSPEKMAPLCGIPAARLREVARTYARSRASIIFWGMGISQHVHGTDNSRCLISLAMITGHVGRPGTGLHPLRGQNNVQGASDAGLIPMVFPDYLFGAGCRDPRADGGLQGHQAQYQAGADGGRDHQCDPRRPDQGHVCHGRESGSVDPDQHHARSALAKLEHLVVQDIFLTETAWHADVWSCPPRPMRRSWGATPTRTARSRSAAPPSSCPARRARI